LGECPLAEAAGDLDFPAFVTSRLTDRDSWDWFPAPLPENTLAAIHRHLVASANWDGVNRRTFLDSTTPLAD
jgi:hypothetical protein